LFDTGKKEWRTFDKWPIGNAEKRKLYFHSKGKLDFNAPKEGKSVTEYVSDPSKPVPYTANYKQMSGFTPFEYMSEDQRFASTRPDVLVFETDILTEDITLGGEINALLKFSTTGTDADFFVKLIDVYPDDEKNHAYMPDPKVVLAGYQQMVRSEVMRARFRNSFEKPEPVPAGKVTDLKFRLQDVLHTFKKGHRIMVQVQSTAFPLFDRNPQKYVENIYKAQDSDFTTAKHTIYHQADAPSSLEVEIIK
jgi:putative CocE/NonD family hydrolase